VETIVDIVPVEVAQTALSWPARAEAAVVVDDASYGFAAELLKNVKALRNQIADFCKPEIARWHDGHKASLKRMAELEAPLTIAEATIKKALTVYATAQDAKRKAEEARLAALAREEEEARRLVEAAALEAEGVKTGDQEMVQTAQDIMAAPVVAPVITLPKATPTVAGVSMRETYVVTGIDIKALVLAAAKDDNLLGYLQPNESAIGSVVRSTKGLVKIPGVSTDVKKVASASGR